MHALCDVTPEGIFLADVEGNYTSVNAAGCAMLDCGSLPTCWTTRQSSLSGADGSF